MLFVALSSARTSLADDVDAALRQIITDQMEAFQSDNAAAAFAFAAPAIKERFQKPDIFMKMVRQGYRPVYRPKSVSFGQFKQTSHGPTQEVFVIGPDGKSWLALYTFEEQPDGSWRISGCYLTEDEAQAI
ncbi:DUF4864 domain-containing protein [Stappia sp. F7233]|uniref:DUF4864 domain-containing protein n=2 Tax=Stappia albiluteola TaxID=2758565 RepID=A0A839ACV2_9HYPH|nr:DUF4864 domain-containing protein [Stappia albiluteola]